MGTANGYAPDSPQDANLSVTAHPAIGSRVLLPEMPDDARKVQEHIRRAWKAYRGDWTGRMPLTVERGDPDDNVLVNRCAPIVDKGVSFLFGQAPKIEVKDATGEHDGPAAAQKALDAALGDPDDLMTTLTMLAMNGAVAGQAFAKLLPARPDPEHPDDHDADDYPRIVVQDPGNYWVVTDPDDVNCALHYVCEYDLNEMPSGRVLTKRVVTAREARDANAWTISTYLRERPTISGNGSAIVPTTGDGGGAWQLIAQEEWPYEWAPIHDCMNLPNPNEYWGVSDLTSDLIHLNGVLNYVQSNVNKIGRLHGTPFTFATGIDAKDVTTAPGRVICFPSPEAKVGAVQWSGDIANLMAYAGDIRSDMDEQSRVPAVALGRLKELPKGNLSGVALQLLFQPLIEKTTLKRRLYGALLRALCEHMLEMLGFPGLKVHVTWPNLLPVDDLAAAQTAQLLQQIGVSADTLMQQLGYDPEAEAQKVADAAKKQLDAYAKGQGLPPTVSMGPQGPDGQQQPPSASPSAPPTNHPAAIAQRNATKAVAAAMKSGASARSRKA